jgi:hypothetical protein
MSVRWTEDDVKCLQNKHVGMTVQTSPDCARSAKPSKYRNRKATRGTEHFDSEREAKRWDELKLLAAAGEIGGLCRQVRFVVIPPNGEDRGTIYVADFLYVERSGQCVIEDAKGFATNEFKLKKKLMRQQYQIEVREV